MSLSGNGKYGHISLLRKNLNIKPTLEIRPGYLFNIIVTKDLIFRTAYAAR